MNDSNFKKAFDIGKIPKNIDLNSPPVTGFDYLYRVRLEARKCPKVLVSDMDTTRFLARQTVQVDANNGFVRARPGFEPDPTWQDEQMDTFRSIRTEMFQNRERLQEKFPKRDLPKIAKEEEWCLFCLGSKFHKRIYGEGSVAHDEIYADSSVLPNGIYVESSVILEGICEDPSEVGQPKTKKFRHCDSTSSPLIKLKMEKSTHCDLGNPPLLSIMLYLNQTRIIRLLAYHVSWLEDSGFSDAQGKWLYALLLCLEKPLDPNTCALLRSLSRVCSKLRGELSNSDDEFLRPMNLILSLISQFFDQKDMSDCFLIE